MMVIAVARVQDAFELKEFSCKRRTVKLVEIDSAKAWIMPASTMPVKSFDSCSVGSRPRLFLSVTLSLEEKKIYIPH